MWEEYGILILMDILKRIDDWGNESIHIPGWAIFGLFVFVLPIGIVILAWTYPICQTDNQTQCMINIPNVRIYMSLTALGFPGLIGIMYLRFVSLQRHIDSRNGVSSE